MRKCILALAVAALATVTAGTNAATVQLVTYAGGNIASGSVVSTGNIAWTSLTGQYGTSLGTIIEKEFTGLGTLGWTVNFEGLDFPDLNGGLRWVESITNSTSVAWTDYHLRLDQTSGVFFGDTTFSPSLVTIGAGPSVTVNNMVGLSVVDGGKGVDIFFATPLASGSSFAIYTPIVGLISAPGFFTLEQTPTVPLPGNPTVPLPATVWTGALLFGGIIVNRLRRRTN